jgi:hypothetical protein
VPVAGWEKKDQPDEQHAPAGYGDGTTATAREIEGTRLVGAAVNASQAVVSEVEGTDLAEMVGATVIAPLEIDGSEYYPRS